MLAGIFALIGSTTLFGVLPCLTHYLQGKGALSEQMVFWTFLITFLGAGLLIQVTEQSFKVSVPQFLLLLLVGGAGIGATNYLLNRAYQEIPVGMATMFHFFYPTIVTFALVVAFKEGFGILKGLAVICSIVGMFLLADFSGGINPVGVAIALASACTYSFFIITTDHGPTKNLSSLVKLFYAGLGAAIVFGVISRENLLPDMGPIPLLLMFTLLCPGLAAAYFLMTFGVRRIGSQTASFFSMLEPLVSVVFSSFLYRYTLSRRILIGCCLVLASMLFMSLAGLLKDR